MADAHIAGSKAKTSADTREAARAEQFCGLPEAKPLLQEPARNLILSARLPQR